MLPERPHLARDRVAVASRAVEARPRTCGGTTTAADERRKGEVRGGEPVTAEVAAAVSEPLGDWRRMRARTRASSSCLVFGPDRQLPLPPAHHQQARAPSWLAASQAGTPWQFTFSIRRRCSSMYAYIRRRPSGPSPSSSQRLRASRPRRAAPDRRGTDAGSSGSDVVRVRQDLLGLGEHALGGNQNRHSLATAGAARDEPVHALHVALLGVVETRPLQRPARLLAEVTDRDGDQPPHGQARIIASYPGLLRWRRAAGLGREARGGPRAPLGRLDLAVLRRRGGDERGEQLLRRDRATSSTARSKASALACDGFVEPLTLRTYWSAARADLVLRRGRLEVMECSDVATHAVKVRQIRRSSSRRAPRRGRRPGSSRAASRAKSRGGSAVGSRRERRRPIL